jgi:hypothetical protein
MEGRRGVAPHVATIWDLSFTSDPRNGFIFDSQEGAAWQCAQFNDPSKSSGVEIPSSEGGTFTARNFTVEELEPGKFVVYCRGPFKLAAKKGA